MTWAVVECHVPIDGSESPDDVGFDRRFGEPSRLTRPDGALRAVAGELRSSGATDLDLAALICSRVHDHFAYEWGVTTVETTAAEAWPERAASARTTRTAWSRSAGSAACRRATSPATCSATAAPTPGSRCSCAEPGGAVTAVPFDPTHDRRAGPRYVTVAVGRDYGDVPPTSGTFEGPYAGELTTHKRAAVVRVEYLQPPRRRRVVRD